MTLLSFAKVQRYVLGGDPSDAVQAAREVPLGMSLASLALAVLCFAGSLVILPVIKGRLVDPAVSVLQAGPRPADAPRAAAVVASDGPVEEVAAGPADAAKESP